MATRLRLCSCTYRDIGMDVVASVIGPDEATSQLVHSGREHLESFVVFCKNLLNGLNLEFQGIEARHIA